MNAFFKKVVVSAVSVGLALGLGANPIEAKGEKPVTLYIVPHQDDELLTYGVGILNHTWYGDEVHVALMTDGGASNAINILNKKLDTPLTKQEFIEARLREFDRSAQVLGIEPDNIHYYGYPDAGLKSSDVEKVVLDFLKDHPNAKIKTMSWLDAHADHKATGVALKNLYDKGIVKDARFYLKISQFGNEKKKGMIADRYNPQFYPFLLAGYESYNHWHPESGWYAVGHTSVKKSFEILKAKPVSLYHTPTYKGDGKK